MLPSKASFFDHFRCLRQAAKAHGVTAILDVETARVFLRRDGQHWVLYPRLLGEVDGVLRYSMRFEDDAIQFAGWSVLGQTAGWPAAQNKLVFKREAMAAGLPVPPFAVNAQAKMADVVVKRVVGSFGENVHGPFRDSTERPLDVAAGEYYERFIPGRILKVWYWQSRPIVMECDQPASVLGDGTRSFREFILARLPRRYREDEAQLERILERCSQMLRYDGLSLAEVPARDQHQRIEFRYGVQVMQDRDRRVIDLTADADRQWQLFRDAGPAFSAMLPDAWRAHAPYAVDAVQDTQGAIWLLEMNSHPVIHPLLYEPMVRALASSQTSALPIAALPEAASLP